MSKPLPFIPSDLEQLMLLAMLEYDADEPELLADVIRLFGVPEIGRRFVAAIVDGTYQRTGREVLREIHMLGSLRAVTEHYKAEKKLGAKDPAYRSMEEVHSAVAERHGISVEALKRRKTRADKRKRLAARKKKKDN